LRGWLLIPLGGLDCQVGFLLTDFKKGE
jgi:hypothetical protein